MRRDAGKKGGRDFSYKMPRTVSNLQHFPRCPFLFAHLCLTDFFLYILFMNCILVFLTLFKNIYKNGYTFIDQRILYQWEVFQWDLIQPLNI